MTQDNGFSSVETRLRAYVRPAASTNALPLAYDNPALLEAEPETKLDRTNMSKDLLEFLTALDAKMDTVISLISQKRLEDDFSTLIEVIEISGDGLTFTSKSPMNKGDILEFALVLNQYPLRVASTVGHIVGVDDAAYRAEFTRLREADLEAIVRFVFNEQRQRIRESKLNE